MVSLDEIEAFREVMCEYKYLFKLWLVEQYATWEMNGAEDIEIFSYQKDYLADTSPRKIMCCGRQIGKSVMTIAEGVAESYCESNYEILLISQDRNKTYELFGRLKDMINLTPLMSDYVVTDNIRELKFKNGSVIRCLSGTPKAVRGYTANMVIIDEAGSIGDDKVYTAIKAAVARRKGSIRILSTPNLKSGFFYKIWDTDYKQINKRLKEIGKEELYEWKKYHIPSYKNKALDKKWFEEQKTELSEADYKREVEGLFVDEDEETLFNIAKIEECATLKRERPDYDKYDYYAGVDISRQKKRNTKGDYTAIAIFKVPRGLENLSEIKHVEMCALYYWRDSTTVSRRRIAEHFIEWKPRRMYIDENGVGGGVFDALKDDLYRQNVEGVQNIIGLNLRGTERTDTYLRVADLIEDDKVMFISNQDLIEHFKSFSVTRDKYGKSTVVKSPNKHDDIADACVFALSGIITEIGTGKTGLQYMSDIDFENIIDLSTPNTDRSFYF